MRTPYIKDLANRDGPEPCVGVREGAAKRWTGVRAGWVIEPGNREIGVPTPFQ